MPAGKRGSLHSELVRPVHAAFSPTVVRMIVRPVVQHHRGGGLAD